MKLSINLNLKSNIKFKEVICMKTLYVNNIGGLYDEFYSPVNINYLNSISEAVQNGYLDANAFFWKEILAQENIKNIVNQLIENIDKNKSTYYQNLSIVANPASFISNVLIAKDKVYDQGNTPLEFYQYLETLEILCNLYSSYKFAPYKFTVEQGIWFDEISSQSIVDIVLTPSLNPLYMWIKNEIVPVILKENPDLLFFEGRPSVFFLTLSHLLKKNGYSSHICITRHASEYYSLNKIDFCLRENKLLFSFIDSIILEFFADTEHALINALENEISLEHISNLIYLSDKDEIIQTQYQDQAVTNAIFIGRSGDYNECTISPQKILNIHLEPYQKCYWNKCSFCGINKKYHYKDLTSYNLTEQLELLKKYIKKHKIEYIWFLDEAIQTDKLSIIANFFIENNISVIWQARCRIEEGLLHYNLPQLLYMSGLRELRLGLESGSYHILKLMNKFTNNFSFELLDEIIATYNSHRISIHTPIIIGFPGESKSDRQKTYELLRNLKKNYDLFSFNINILGLDISSSLFKEWYKYEIKSINLPCEKSQYLGNLVNWESFDTEYSYKTLEHERDSIMRELLYPWLSNHSLVRPYILYRLSETLRNTLIWKTYDLINYKIDNTKNYVIKHAENITIYKLEDQHCFLLYQWNTHHYIFLNENFMQIYKIWNSEITINESIDYIMTHYSNAYSHDDLKTMIYKLIYYGFLITINKGPINYNIKTDLEYYYDCIYFSEEFPYAVKKDSWIEYYENLISKGNALELGVGTGKNIPMLLNMNFSITGVDISGVAIHKLQKKYKSEKCVFKQEDIRSYKIIPNTYDLIICSMTLHYLYSNEVEEIAKSIIKGLKKDGVLFISVLSNNDPLNTVIPSENLYIKTFFDTSYLKQLFNELTIIEISDNYIYEPLRIHPCEYFGTIMYLGKKK